MENITRKEWAISLVVLFLALSLLVFFEPFLKDGIIDEVTTYEQAIKIENNSTGFTYAQQTNVGNVLAYGPMVALEPQSIAELQGQYAIVVKIQEHYTQHSRQVCASYDKKNNCTSYRTEYYYTWDYSGSDEWQSQTYSFMGVMFSIGQVSLSASYSLDLNESTVSPEYLNRCSWDYLYEDLNWFGQPGGDDRWYYRILPISTTGTIFVQFFDGQMRDPFNANQRITYHLERGINDVLDAERSKVAVFSTIYYSIGLVLCLGGYFFWAYYAIEVR